MRSVQFTIDDELLSRVDADPEVKALGRSAFLRKAIIEYLRRRRDDEIRQAYRRGYGASPVDQDELLSSSEALAWPEE